MIRTTPQEKRARQSPQSETDGGHKGRLYLWELSTDDGAEGACEGRRLYRVVLRRRESAFALQAVLFQMNLPTGERIPVSGTAGGVLGVGKVTRT
jgi:hypothetical protein